jgi:hypothetical protein
VEIHWAGPQSMAWMMAFHLHTVATNCAVSGSMEWRKEKQSMSYNHSKIPGLPG